MTGLVTFAGFSVLPRARRKPIINLKTNLRTRLPKPQILPPLRLPSPLPHPLPALPALRTSRFALSTFLRIVCQKLKKRLSEVTLSKSIKELSNDKSTLQNEIVGDLQSEFSSAPDKGELPREKFCAALEYAYSGDLSKYFTGLVSRVVGGFNIFRCKTSSFQDMGWIPTAPTQCYSLLLPWSPPTALVPEQRVNLARYCRTT